MRPVKFTFIKSSFNGYLQIPKQAQHLYQTLGYYDLLHIRIGKQGFTTIRRWEGYEDLGETDGIDLSGEDRPVFTVLLDETYAAFKALLKKDTGVFTFAQYVLSDAFRSKNTAHNVTEIIAAITNYGWDKDVIVCPMLTFEAPHIAAVIWAKDSERLIQTFSTIRNIFSLGTNDSPQKLEAFNNSVQVPFIRSEKDLQQFINAPATIKNGNALQLSIRVQLTPKVYDAFIRELEDNNIESCRVTGYHDVVINISCPEKLKAALAICKEFKGSTKVGEFLRTSTSIHFSRTSQEKHGLEVPLKWHVTTAPDTNISKDLLDSISQHDIPNEILQMVAWADVPADCKRTDNTFNHKELVDLFLSRQQAFPFKTLRLISERIQYCYSFYGYIPGVRSEIEDLQDLFKDAIIPMYKEAFEKSVQTWFCKKEFIEDLTEFDSKNKDLLRLLERTRRSLEGKSHTSLQVFGRHIPSIGNINFIKVQGAAKTACKLFVEHLRASHKCFIGLKFHNTVIFSSDAISEWQNIFEYENKKDQILYKYIVTYLNPTTLTSIGHAFMLGFHEVNQNCIFSIIKKTSKSSVIFSEHVKDVLFDWLCEPVPKETLDTTNLKSLEKQFFSLLKNKPLRNTFFNHLELESKDDPEKQFSHKEIEQLFPELKNLRYAEDDYTPSTKSAIKCVLDDPSPKNLDDVKTVADLLQLSVFKTAGDKWESNDDSLSRLGEFCNDFLTLEIYSKINLDDATQLNLFYSKVDSVREKEFPAFEEDLELISSSFVYHIFCGDKAQDQKTTINIFDTDSEPRATINIFVDFILGYHLLGQNIEKPPHIKRNLLRWILISIGYILTEFENCTLEDAYELVWGAFSDRVFEDHDEPLFYEHNEAYSYRKNFLTTTISSYRLFFSDNNKNKVLSFLKTDPICKNRIRLACRLARLFRTSTNNDTLSTQKKFLAELCRLCSFDPQKEKDSINELNVVSLLWSLQSQIGKNGQYINDLKAILANK